MSEARLDLKRQFAGDMPAVRLPLLHLHITERGNTEVSLLGQGSPPDSACGHDNIGGRYSEASSELDIRLSHRDPGTRRRSNDPLGGHSRAHRKPHALTAGKQRPNVLTTERDVRRQLDGAGGVPDRPRPGPPRRPGDLLALVAHRLAERPTTQPGRFCGMLLARTRMPDGPVVLSGDRSALVRDGFAPWGSP